MGKITEVCVCVEYVDIDDIVDVDVDCSSWENNMPDENHLLDKTWGHFFSSYSPPSPKPILVLQILLLLKVINMLKEMLMVISMPVLIKM